MRRYLRRHRQFRMCQIDICSHKYVYDIAIYSICARDAVDRIAVREARTQPFSMRCGDL